MDVADWLRGLGLEQYAAAFQNNDIDQKVLPHRLDFGYVLARTFWGQGLMTEALTEVADWALRQDGIWRIGGGTDVENLASARVMEKAGLTREGILRRWIMHPNISPEPRDWVSYAKVR